MCTKASHTSGWLSCIAAPARVDLDCQWVVSSQEGGGDPTEMWRARCAANLGRDYRIAPPTQVAAVFVAQWYLGALARAGAHLALAGPLLPALEPRYLSIQRSGPGGHPVGVGLAADTPFLERGDFPDRLDGAEQDYRAHAHRFMESYQPGVKLGSALRRGSIDDAWDAAAASVEEGRRLPSRRASCCFIYALPGVNLCARCPRKGS